MFLKLLLLEKKCVFSRFSMLNVFIVDGIQVQRLQQQLQSFKSQINKHNEEIRNMQVFTF